MSKKKSNTKETVDQGTFDERLRIWSEIWSHKGAGCVNAAPKECADEAIEVHRQLRAK